MLEINEKIILANKQIIKFERVIIEKPNDEIELNAEVQFGIYNENNERIDRIFLNYSGAEYNQWWEDFNNGKFLYDELVSKNNLNIEVPEDIENDFKI